MRLDKWLWAARFYKTRGLASTAVTAGRVRANGAMAKPAREVKPGDRLHIQAGDQHWEIIVKGLNEQRRPAAEAQLLYEETPDSAQRSAREVELRRLSPQPVPEQKGRPTKRDRRQLNRVREG